jgi:hypothetical protein
MVLAIPAAAADLVLAVMQRLIPLFCWSLSLPSAAAGGVVHHYSYSPVQMLYLTILYVLGSTDMTLDAARWFRTGMPVSHSRVATVLAVWIL